MQRITVLCVGRVDAAGAFVERARVEHVPLAAHARSGHRHGLRVWCTRLAALAAWLLPSFTWCTRANTMYRMMRGERGGTLGRGSDTLPMVVQARAASRAVSVRCSSRAISPIQQSCYCCVPGV